MVLALMLRTSDSSLSVALLLRGVLASVMSVKEEIVVAAQLILISDDFAAWRCRRRRLICQTRMAARQKRRIDRATAIAAMPPACILLA
jgi:hypothetical protein